MALFTPPPIPSSSSGRSASGSSSDSASQQQPPADPATRYPNPTFGLFIWGPLVPASDCRECLYTLSFLQIAGGLFLWWVPARGAFTPQHPYSQPTPTTSPTGQTIPPSFTQYAPYDGRKGPIRASSPSSSTSSAFAYGQRPLSGAALWRNRFIRASSIFSGAYLMFFAGLELVRLQLPYDPWADDASQARRRANDKIVAAGGQKVSTWFGPKGYRAVEYREWKRRVDENLESRGLRFYNKPPKTTLEQQNDIPQELEQNGIRKITLRQAIRIKNRQRVKELLESIEEFENLEREKDDNDSLYDQYSSDLGLIPPVKEKEKEKETSHNTPMPIVNNNKPIHFNDQTSLSMEEEAELEAQLEALAPTGPDDCDDNAVMNSWESFGIQGMIYYRFLIHYLEPWAYNYIREKNNEVEGAEELEKDIESINEKKEKEEEDDDDSETNDSSPSKGIDEKLFTSLLKQEIEQQRKDHPDGVVDSSKFFEIFNNTLERYDQATSEHSESVSSEDNSTATTNDDDDKYDYYVPTEKNKDDDEEDLDDDLKIKFDNDKSRKS